MRSLAHFSVDMSNVDRQECECAAEVFDCGKVLGLSVCYLLTILCATHILHVCHITVLHTFCMSVTLLCCTRCMSVTLLCCTR